MTIREALPNRKVNIIVNRVDDNGKTVEKVTFNVVKGHENLLDMEFLSVIPLQKRYIFFVRNVD